MEQVFGTMEFSFYLDHHGWTVEQLLDCHPKNASMVQHVTGWEDLIRKLKEWKVPL
jgi:hypothetical protein